LNRDISQKSGQIAHLDKDNSNPSIANLCFLCFDHHDDYDSRTSQRKNFTIEEVKSFRSELYLEIENSFKKFMIPGIAKSNPATVSFEGDFVRIDCGDDGAEVSLIPLPTKDGISRYAMMGIAFARCRSQYGPNIGSISTILEKSPNGVLWSHDYSHNKDTPHKISFYFKDGFFYFTEENFFGTYGMSVTFNGKYVKDHKDNKKLSKY